MFKMLFEVLSQKSLMIQAAQRADQALERSRTLSEAAFAALLDGTEPEQDLYELDRKINEDEVTVRRMVLEHLAANPIGDLSAGVVLISTIIDIERVGDYAKNVFEQAERLGEPFGEVDLEPDHLSALTFHVERRLIRGHPDPKGTGLDDAVEHGRLRGHRGRSEQRDGGQRGDRHESNAMDHGACLS